MNIIESIEKDYMKAEIPQFEVGDTVKVYVKVVEGNRERLQAYEGIVIARKHGGVSETFTVRRVSFGVGIERTFPLHSPRIDRIEVVKKGKVRRATICVSSPARQLRLTKRSKQYFLLYNKKAHSVTSALFTSIFFWLNQSEILKKICTFFG